LIAMVSPTQILCSDASPEAASTYQRTFDVS